MPPKTQKTEHSELEVKCLAIMSRNSTGFVGIAYHMNKRFKRSAAKSSFSLKVNHFKHGTRKRHMSVWRKYYDRPQHDQESLAILKEMLGFDFIAVGGCL